MVAVGPDIRKIAPASFAFDVRRLLDLDLKFAGFFYGDRRNKEHQRQVCLYPAQGLKGFFFTGYLYIALGSLGNMLFRAELFYLLIGLGPYL